MSKSTKKYLIFDIGASSGKVSLADFDGKIFKLKSIYRFNNGAVQVGGILYWDILNIYSEIKKGISIAYSNSRNIVSMAIDTWGCTFGFLDKNKKLLSNPIHFRIKNFDNIVNKFYELIPRKELFELTGGFTNISASIYRLYFLKYINATELKCADRFLMIPDILNYFLTNEAHNEHTMATTTALYDLRKSNWQYKIIEKMGISKDIFQDIIFPGSIVGKINKSVCEELNIEPLNVISSVSHDTASAVSGIPSIEKDINWGFVSTGTWFVLGLETDCPIFSDEVFNNGFANEGNAFSKNMLIKDITGFWILQKCMERWIRDENLYDDYTNIVSLINKEGSFKYFINVEDPLFKMNHSNMPEAIRDYCRKYGREVPDSKKEIINCIFESLVMVIKKNIDLLEKTVNMDLESIYILGGGAKNDFFCQWIANLTKKTVIKGHTEGSSVGNLISQLKADKEISALEEGRKISYESADIKKYFPEDVEKWQEGYGKYLKSLAGYN